MTITYDGYEVRQLDLNDLFGERDVFLSILNPLYFIEELGENGKNLLEMYLPMVPHEVILSHLTSAVQERLKNEALNCPEAYLKKRREEIRELEERITYLHGQKDLAFSQKEANGQAKQKLTQQLEQLRTEIHALEEKQLSGMDVPSMQERLVELSRQYEESAQDGHADTVSQQQNLLVLREKIAKRQAEPYQSKYTQPLAEVSAKVKELGVRYARENASFKAFRAGMDCPTCHRPVTENSLAEVQAALKKILSELYAEGSEQQRQLLQLRELEQKAQATFEQFKTEDLQKWQTEAAALEQVLKQQSTNATQQIELLRTQIQTLTTDLEYGTLNQEEYETLNAYRESYRQLEANLAALCSVNREALPDFSKEIEQANAQIADLKRLINDVAIYACKRAELTFSQLKMNKVEISLYDVVKSTGEAKEAFKFTYGGRRYDRLSLSEKIRAGMEVSELIKRLTGRNYPVFVDNMESVDDLSNVRPTGQIIMAKCVSGTVLQVRPMNPIIHMEQRAA